MKNINLLLIAFFIFTVPFELVGQGKVSRPKNQSVSSQQNKVSKKVISSSSVKNGIEEHLFSLVAVYQDKIIYLSPDDWNRLKNSPENNTYNILGILISGSRFFEVMELKTILKHLLYLL